MAKCRFPGKALKLNARKRIKFNWDSEKNPDELRVLQIKSGLLLFRQLFGDSDEENEFDGFSSNEALSNDRQSCSSYPNQKKTNIISSLPSQKTNYKNSKKVAEEKRKNEKEDQNKEKSNFSSELLLPVVPVVERRSSRVFNKAPKLDLLQKGPVVNGTINDNLHCDELNERLIFKRKKLLMKDSERISKKFGLPTISAHTSGERSSKKFILPTISAHSSRVIKPNMRIFSDMTGSSCANSTTKCDEETELSIKLPFILKPPVKFGNQSLRSNTAEFEEETEKDPVCRSITLYTDAITEQLKSSIGRGRPPKKVGRQTETQGQEELIVTGESLSPVKGAKEDKVKEKIEKLLRSPWDERLKQNASHVNCMKDPEVCISSASKTILRKARLNLNNKTLQKIRSPSSLQHLLPASETDSRNRKCGLCQLASFKTVICYGVSCCETCQLSVNCFIAGTFSSLICQGSQGACQLVGLSPQERCEACWLAKILATCAMPNLLHDSLRKQLPFIIKEKVPTSIGRSFNVNSVSQSQRDGIGDESNKCFSGEDLSCGGFGSLIDLPGGWKRKCGNEVIVLGPSGEKFRSISKLEEYLKLQGINADAGVLFGNLKPNKRKDSIKDSKHKSKIHNKLNNVVVTTLPGGWSRHMKWRHRGDKFDTYVCSPDGRTFRTRKDLLAYFHKIGKVDDMNKYFPLKSSPQSYSENSEASTMEPFSEASSEISTDKSVVESDSDREINTETRIGEIINDELRNSISSTRNYNLVDSLSTYSKSDADKISEKSSSVIISNFANSILTNSHAEGEDLGSTNNSYLNFQNEDSLSVSSISESFQGDSSAIDLNFLSDGKLNESSDSHFKYKNFDEQETQQLDTKLPNNLTSSTIFDMFKDRCKHKHKKHKKKKKKHHSHRKYEPGEGSNVCFNNMGKDCEEHVRSDNSTFKLNVNENYSIDEINKCNSVEDKNKIITQGAYEKEADSNSVKLVSIDDFLLSKVADISNDNNASETKCTNTDITSVPFVNSMDSTVLPSNSINLAQVIADDDIQKVLTPHPNDTWSTLLNHSSFEVEKPSSNVKCLSKEAAVTANLTEGNSTIENEASTPKLSLLAPKLIPTPKRKNQKSIFSKVKFGNGWHRKIKWNNEGQGKIVFLTSPDGQKIVSSIELLAYFKKAGKSMPKLEYYFPQNIVKDVCIDNVQEISANAKSLYIDNTEDSTKEKQSNDTLTQCKKSNERIMAKFGRGRGRRVLYKLPKSKFGKRALKQLNSTASDSTDLLKLDEKEQNCNISLNGQEEVAVHLDGGPRVKHVCRSQAQVLGMPRAVFPSPEGKTIARKIIYSEKKPKQYLAVATPKGKKILRKTIWCHKCPGCTTPNCKKCSNCLDMKKYGGPGTKKKPCIMRKCHNPFRAIKVSNSKENLSSFEGELSEKESVEKNELSSKKGDSDVLSIKLSSLQSSESDVLDDFESDKYLGKNHCNSTEKSIFIPKPLNRHNNDAKDRVDILEGKEFIPGARVNIDYWQDYDADEMLINGFPIITSFPLDIESLCFRCGSGGLEEMLYCIWCCEGVHPFCLEEGEGPESDEQETLWVCKKCTVCHVCGAPNDLMQCNDCRRHFHIECLGPLSHISCHTTSDGSWKSEAMKLLSLSLPKQTPLIDVGDCESNLTSVDEVSAYLYEQLEKLEDSMSEIPRKYFLPSASSKFLNWQYAELFASPDKSKKRDIFIESICIEDTPENLEEEGGFCLEDEFEGFSDILPVIDLDEKVNSIDMFTNVDLYSDLVQSESVKAAHNLVRMNIEEYLGLGYSKITDYCKNSTDFSLLQILHMLQVELFTVLNYPTWSQLHKKGLVKEDSWKMNKMDGESICAEEQTENDCSLNLKSVIGIRRAEVQLDIKEQQEIRIMEERRIREIERENARKRRLLMEKEKLKKLDDIAMVPSLEEDAYENFLRYEDLDEKEEDGEALWQPQTWEEFDSLFIHSSADDSSEKASVDLHTCDQIFNLDNSNCTDLKVSSITTTSFEIKKEECMQVDTKRNLKGNEISKRKRFCEEIKNKKLKLFKCTVQMPKIDELDEGNSYNLNESSTDEPNVSHAKVTESFKVVSDGGLTKLNNCHNLKKVLALDTEDQPLEFNNECIDKQAFSLLGNEIIHNNWTKDSDCFVEDISQNESSLHSKSVNSMLIDEGCASLSTSDGKKERKIKENVSGALTEATINLESRRSSRASHGRASELASLRKALLDM